MEPRNGKKITINTQIILSFPSKSLRSISTRAMIQRKQTDKIIKIETNNPRPANNPIK